jgi:hypothetical protein
MYVATPPDIDPPGNWIDVLMRAGDVREKRTYLHWDKLRRLKPPAEASVEEWWWAIKFRRSTDRHLLPLKTADPE